MASSNSIFTSINTVLRYVEKQNMFWLIHSLRPLRSFLICTRRLDIKEQLRTEQNNDDLDGSLGSLFVRIEDFFCRFQNDIHSRRLKNVIDYVMEIRSFEAEIEKWYIILPDCLGQLSSASMTNQVMDIIDSVLVQLAAFRVFPSSYPLYLREQVDDLKDSITFLRNFIRFATLTVYDELQEFPAFLIHIEGLAINAAHVMMRLFWNKDEASHHDGTKLMISALLHKTLNVDAHSYETYTRVLADMKNSIRVSHFPTLNTANPIIIVDEFFVYFLSNIWHILLLDTVHLFPLKEQLLAIYEDLRFLRTCLKENPNKFIDVRIRDLVGVVICDTGILIFSLCQKDVVTDSVVADLLETIQVIRTEFEELVLPTYQFNFPKTNVLGFLDYLLDNLQEVRSRKVFLDIQSSIDTIEQHLLFLRSVLEKLVAFQDQQEEIQALYDRAIELAPKMEFLIDHLLLGVSQDSFAELFESISQDIKIIKIDDVKIFNSKRLPIQPEGSSMPLENSTTTTDDVVGFETEIRAIIDRLTRGSKKLQVVAIVGMPGSGKTTLARKVYNSNSVMLHFSVCAWCSISQIFDLKKVLLTLLTQILVNLPHGYFKKAEPELTQELWRSLKKRRYLDDVWETKAFDHIKESFPDDMSESRILVTSRQHDVAPETLLDEKPLVLRLLTSGESLELLKKKLSLWKDWPASLYDFRIQIVECCKGLPLTVVIVAGILSTIEPEGWKDILESLQSGIISSTEQCNNAVELSYKFLPDHLKSCFLFFGVYPEDYEISVKRMIWYWIAEGFVRKTKLKSVEEVATDYLNNLIGRSLVLVAKKSSRGDAKTCCTHDLLHDFCLRKAEEEYFFHLLRGEKELLSFHGPGNLRRLCIYSNQEQFKEGKLFCPRLRSLLFYDHSNPRGNDLPDMSFIFSVFTLLKVLDIEHIGTVFDFPSEIGHLVQLRYLAIQAISTISASIGNLSNLEIFIIRAAGQGCITMPETFWNLQKLRHLYTRRWDSGIEIPVNNLDSSSNLYELASLSTLFSHDWSTMKNLIRKFPNIRRLRCVLDACGVDTNNGNNAMVFSFPSQVESLHAKVWGDSADSVEFVFLENLKKLTLEGCRLPWEKIKTIAELPHLEVLKLLDESFVGETWSMEEGYLPKLRFLKLQDLDIVKWAVSDGYDEFPNLQKLVLSRCSNLEEIPIDSLQYNPTLEMIEVYKCSDYVTNSVDQIREVQVEEMGKSDFVVLVRSN